MKTITILLFTLAIAMTVSAQYHIRVECFTENEDARYQSYAIYFTADNWHTKQTINTTFDCSSEDTPVDVYHDVYIFVEMDTAEQQAIEYAKRFKSYQQCINYNEAILKKYHQLLTYRKAHPIPKPIVPVKKACCKVTQVY